MTYCARCKKSPVADHSRGRCEKCLAYAVAWEMNKRKERAPGQCKYCGKTAIKPGGVYCAEHLAEVNRYTAKYYRKRSVARFEFSACGVVFGTREGLPFEVRNAFAYESGYRSWSDMLERAKEFGGNNVMVRRIN